MIDELVTWLRDRRPDCIGHRVVFGGSRYRQPQRITRQMLDDLRSLVPEDPSHLKQAIDGVDQMSKIFPEAVQVACFDTAFHEHMPRVAQIYALPRELVDAGVMRYGYHGLSCEYVMAELGRLDPAAASGRVVIAHLGNGASMTAVRDGVGVDTTMGFTPTGGLVMGTRSGDLDPGVLVYLVQQQGTGGTALSRLVNSQAGMLAVSELSADMRELLEKEDEDYHAKEAVDLFCYQARKFLGGLAAVLGGLETLIFTGGIGEHAVAVRERICDELAFLGIGIEEGANSRAEAVISSSESKVTVRVMHTDEDLVIARHTHAVACAAK